MSHGRNLFVHVAFSIGLAGTAEAIQDPPRAPEETARAVETLLQRSEAAAQRTFEPRFRAAAAASLGALPEDELQSRLAAGGGIAPLEVGDSNTQLVYTPVTPCRLIDTRVAGGPLAPGGVRDFRVTGTGLQTQGGDPAGCGVPFGPATAAVINFVAVNPSGPGNLRAWAFSTPPQPPPNASIINYPFGLTLANGVVVPICDPALTTCSSFELRVQADMNGTQLVADVLGYFERFPKEVVKTFSRIDFGDAATPAIAGTCTHVTGTAVTLTATAAGRITVRGLLVGTLGHVQAAGDESLFTFVGTSPTDCAANSSAHALPSAAASGTYGVTVPVLRFFDVTPGTYTYYLNAFVGGAGGGAAADSATAAQSNIEATFVPN